LEKYVPTLPWLKFKHGHPWKKYNVTTFLAAPFCAFTFTMWEHSIFPNMGTWGHVGMLNVFKGNKVPMWECYVFPNKYGKVCSKEGTCAPTWGCKFLMHSQLPHWCHIITT